MLASAFFSRTHWLNQIIRGHEKVASGTEHHSGGPSLMHPSFLTTLHTQHQENSRFTSLPTLQPINWCQFTRLWNLSKNWPFFKVNSHNLFDFESIVGRFFLLRVSFATYIPTNIFIFTKEWLNYLTDCIYPSIFWTTL